MKKLLTIIFISLSFSVVAQNSPENCYDQLVDFGNQAMNEGDFGLAILRYSAAYTCDYKVGDDQLKKLIEDAISALELARQKAEKAEQLAIANEQLAKSAEQEAKIERDAKEAALIEAQQQGKIAESMLLTSLSNYQRNTGAHQEALYTAFAVLKYNQNQILPEWKRAFAEAVQKSMTENLLQGDSPFQQFYPLPDGRGFAAISKDEVFIRKFGEEGNAKKVAIETGSLWDLKVSPKGSFLASWSGAGKVQIWNDSGEKFRDEKLHEEPVLYATFSQDESYLVSCSRDNTASLSNLKQAGKKQLSGHKGNIYFAAFFPGEKHLLTRSSDGTARVWDINAGTHVVLGADDVYVNQASILPDGNRILTVSAKGKARIWTRSGKNIFSFNQNPYPIREGQYLEGANILLRTTRDLFTWNYEENSSVEIASGIVYGTSVHPKGKLFCYWGPEKGLNLYDITNQRSITFQGLHAAVRECRFSPDGQYLLSIQEDESFILWDLKGNIVINSDMNDIQTSMVQISPNGTQLLWLDSESNAIKACPMPETAYNSLETDRINTEKKVKEIFRRQDITFLNSGN